MPHLPQPNEPMERMAAGASASRYRTLWAAATAHFVRPLHFMKTFITVIVSVLVGLALGCYVGYRYCDRHITNAAVRQMVESEESSDALAAATSARAIRFIASGEPQKAVETLARPMAHYYSIYATSRFTNEHRLKLRAMIDGLASRNQTVAAQIAAEKGVR